MNLAQILYDAYPHSDLLPIDPEADLANLTVLRQKVVSTSVGDGLFSFLAIELEESGGNLDEAIRLLRQARSDVDVVLQAVIAEKQSRRLWQCPRCQKNTEVSYDDLAVGGTPTCSVCDGEMALL